MRTRRSSWRTNAAPTPARGRTDAGCRSYRCARVHEQDESRLLTRARCVRVSSPNCLWRVVSTRCRWLPRLHRGSAEAYRTNSGTDYLLSGGGHRAESVEAWCARRPHESRIGCRRWTGRSDGRGRRRCRRCSGTQGEHRVEHRGEAPATRWENSACPRRARARTVAASPCRPVRPWPREVTPAGWCISHVVAGPQMYAALAGASEAANLGGMGMLRKSSAVTRCRPNGLGPLFFSWQR